MTLLRAAPPAPVADRPDRTRASSGDARVWVRAIAAAALVVLGMRLTLPQGLQAGFVVAALLLPVWWGSLRRHRWGVAFMVAGLLAVALGFWLGVANSGDHVSSSSSTVPMTVVLVGTLFGVGLLLWGTEVLTPERAVLWFGIGLALGFSSGTPLFASNPWKFGFALPVTVIALALAARYGRRWELAVLLTLTIVAALSDFRSAFGLLLLAALLVFAQLAIVRPHRRPSFAAVLIGLGVLGVVVFQLGQALILDGYLGLATQSRSVEQLRVSGSLILGGRPELAATAALMEHHPWGFGAGVVPTAGDIQVAKEGMSSIGYQPDNGYVERFMFGGHFELHSVVGDLWAQSGLMGLVLSAVVFGVLVVGVVRRIADGSASGILLYTAAQSSWNLFFAPFYSAFPTLVVALALAFLPVAREGVQRFRVGATPRLPSSHRSTG
ncbi:MULTISPECIES: hypothetical protein [unclassified Frigoribacterium]|uniref:hypothetical protein n=1 Tax=unclassified Frigoribacterium TaxID=2627005 RepID=UPI0006FD5EA7|nr:MULTISPECIES: hypothetical protein [unclassified Frigoribacterium]KQO47887.1 hypothetical protein ASF07_10810 [Frigoribacterium sp. Leaf254]KQT39981.1 hypothetical protein ASG28_10820 [Frigoribacterium sp. Leaf415]